jgi:hypothetical protein
MESLTTRALLNSVFHRDIPNWKKPSDELPLSRVWSHNQAILHFENALSTNYPCINKVAFGELENNILFIYFHHLLLLRRCQYYKVNCICIYLSINRQRKNTKPCFSNSLNEDLSRARMNNIPSRLLRERTGDCERLARELFGYLQPGTSSVLENFRC